MSSWGNNDNAANAPYWAVSTVSTGVNKAAAAPTAANVELLYGNTTASMYVTGQTAGLFMIDATEAGAGGDNVADVSIVSAGLGYVEAPGVTFSGGGGSGAAATATVAGGVVTNIAVTNTGLNYTSDPTVTIQVPVLTVPASQVIAANDTFMYTTHSQANSAALTYQNNGGTTITGLVQGNTYYVIPTNADKFQLANTAAEAANGVAVAISGAGQNGQYFTINAGERATAVSDRGLSQSQGSAEHATHIGWNLKRVGTGGRAGRVTFETLAVISNPIGDGSDDIALPDA
jgi:hypothetical protein